jgi:hypothetical protein
MSVISSSLLHTECTFNKFSKKDNVYLTQLCSLAGLYYNPKPYIVKRLIRVEVMGYHKGWQQNIYSLLDSPILLLFSDFSASHQLWIYLLSSLYSLTIFTGSFLSASKIVLFCFPMLADYISLSIIHISITALSQHFHWYYPDERQW